MNKPLRKQFSTEWFKGQVTAEEKEKIAQQVLTAAPTLELLADILRKRREELDKPITYEGPNWYHLMSVDLGKKQEIDFLLKLLTPVLTKE